MDKKKTDELTRILEKTSGRKELEGYLDRLPEESVGTGPIDYFLSLPRIAAALEIISSICAIRLLSSVICACC